MNFSNTVTFLTSSARYHPNPKDPLSSLKESSRMMSKERAGGTACSKSSKLLASWSAKAKWICKESLWSKSLSVVLDLARKIIIMPLTGIVPRSIQTAFWATQIRRAPWTISMETWLVPPAMSANTLQLSSLWSQSWSNQLTRWNLPHHHLI